MPETKDKSKPDIKLYRYGFITVDRPTPDHSVQIDKATCLALVSFTSEAINKYSLDLIKLMGFDARAVAAEALKFNVIEIGIDEENYDWIIDAFNAETDIVFNTRSDRRGKLPSIRSVSRDKDALIRQMSVMEKIIQENRYSRATEILNNPELSVLTQAWGRSHIADGFAGAVQLAAEQAEVIRFNQTVSSVKGNRPGRWFGMERQ